ncbi:MAG TPA: histidine kinase, partial [Actinomycetota bacterium]|nr:histidine kinase [Actinomycetota bacterium]
TYPFRFWTPVTDLWALQVAIYTIGSLRPRSRDAWFVAVVGAIAIVSIPPPPVTLAVVGFLLTVMITFGGAAYVGVVVGELRRINLELDRHLNSLEEERRIEVALEMRNEQLTVAREMHDLVAHSLTLMVIQAGAARTVAGTDFSAAREAIERLIEAGDRSTQELNELLRVLGTGEEPGGELIQDLDALVEQARDAGLRVELEQTGRDLLPKGTSLELSTYRIVQESLTNARKHAPGSRVRVRMHVDPTEIGVRVENDGGNTHGRDADEFVGGHGLVGMRERVAMFGGTLEAGPGPAGGFTVEAVIPRSKVVQ